MKLTRKEKEIIFESLVRDFTEFQKSKEQAKRFFKGEKLDKINERINSEEDESYHLLIELSKEIGVEIPEYYKSYKIRK